MRPNRFKEEIPSNPAKIRENLGRNEMLPTVLYDSKQKAQDNPVIKPREFKKPKSTKLGRVGDGDLDLNRINVEEEAKLIRLIDMIPSKTATVVHMVGRGKKNHTPKVHHEAFVKISHLIKRMGMEEHIQISLIEDN